ncbi:acyltransferase [Spirillospora sp. NPDC049024]
MTSTTAGQVTPPAPARSRLRELDLLRFVAAGAVMLHHFAGVRSTVFGGRDAQKVYPELAPVGHFGYLGVELFFLISGFVILMSAWGRSPGDFAVSRIVRIYPAYWFSAVLSVVLYLLCDSAIPFRPDNPDPVQRLLPNLTMLQEGVHVEPLEVVYWTLWVELRFYVLIALFACVGITYRRCVTLMVVWLLASVYATQGNSQLLKTLLLPDQAPYFIAGMAFFLIYRFRSNIALWLVIAACWALSAHYLVQNINPLNKWPGVHETVIPVVVTALYAIMALVALGKLRWLSWRGFTFLGALTYPLYLVHEMVARAIVKAFFPHPILDRLTILPVITVSSFVTAYLVYKLVEGPLQRLMRPRLLAAVAQIQRNGAVPPPASPEPSPDEAERPRHDAPAAPPASVP